MIHVDWGFIIFVTLVSAAAGGFLLCFRHMMHEGQESDAKHNDKRNILKKMYQYFKAREIR